MRDSYYMPAGNCYGGPYYKSALELPAKGENSTEVFSACLMLSVPAAFLYLAEFLTEGRIHNLCLVLGPLLRWAFTIAFGIHYCLRFTVGDEGARKTALMLFFLIGLPLTFLPLGFLLPLLKPRKSWQAIVSWFSYPSYTVPGLWLRPIQGATLIAALSVTLAFPMVLTAIFPATFVTEHDDA